MTTTTGTVSPISNDAALRLGLMNLIRCLEVEIGARHDGVDGIPAPSRELAAAIRLGHIAGERSTKATLLVELRNLLAATR